ncbi:MULTISPECIES: DUF406 family protein [unclassified Vibrio]|uniref:DUF406 family protein n=1 Tax=Vibrio sp. HB236076 TaxID=3232307 RepID=A0AB39HKP0_9VIBR|nr:DUF406 family protein [Vibrio sp. HB161653]MDP5252658.1 DUF406 family protein [Vibrio sp. HB161653]
MSNECNNVCEACGCAGEIGYIIREGDESVSVNLESATQMALNDKIEVYRQLAQSINSEVGINIDLSTTYNNKATLHFVFPVSVEKLIFELKIRQFPQQG